MPHKRIRNHPYESPRKFLFTATHCRTGLACDMKTVNGPVRQLRRGKGKDHAERIMIVTIGSKNPNKIQAVKEAFLMFEPFKNSAFNGLAADSGVSAQPLGLEETLSGAGNRAKNAYGRCDYSVGLESGLVPVPLSRTGYMNLSACAIFDGQSLFVGLGPAFELPDAITRLVVDQKMELDEAIVRSGFSSNPRIGYSEGIIGMLTRGVVTRKDYMVPAVSMALVRLIPERFQEPV